MTYPKFAEVCGTRYPINTSYKVGLRCFQVINDPDICDEERTLAVIYLLFGFVPQENIGEFLRVSEKYLTCGRSGSSGGSGERDMDYNADDRYIEISFLSDYGIDLQSTDLHWWKYNALIEGLTDSSVLSRVREIRTYDLSQVKDEKTRRRIADAKAALALPVLHSAEEKAAIDAFEQLFDDGRR